MSIFISYKRENKDAVQRIAQGLRSAGLAVWWDQDIAPDAPWEQTIETELEKAKVVIVAWSQAAVVSENVKAEARRARDHGKLIQTFVEPCGPPLFFGERQGVDLSSWDGNPSDNRFQAIITAARAILAGKKPPTGVGYRPPRRAPWVSLTATFVLVSALLGLVSNLGGARDAVCSLAAVHQPCVEWRLITEPVDVEAEIEDARRILLQGVAGVWGRQDRSCTDTVSYSVARGEDGYDRITARAPAFESISQVTTAADGVIVARATTSSETGGREQWEFHPNGDQLTVYDKDGVATTLVRCPG